MFSGCRRVNKNSTYRFLVHNNRCVCISREIRQDIRRNRATGRRHTKIKTNKITRDLGSGTLQTIFPARITNQLRPVYYYSVPVSLIGSLLLSGVYIIIYVARTETLYFFIFFRSQR